MKQRGSERMWMRQSVGQEKKYREREHGRKREERGRVTTEKEGGRASERVGEREGEHYVQSALTNQLHSPWPGVNVITAHRPHQSLLHAPLHLVKQMSWPLTN